jgi:hypothetical protein
LQAIKERDQDPPALTNTGLGFLERLPGQNAVAYFPGTSLMQNKVK